MPNIGHELTDNDCEKLTEKAEEIAEFEEGDLVTIKPSGNDVPYHNDHLECAPLRVTNVGWSTHEISRAENARQHHKPDDHEERFVGDYYLDRVEYTLEYAVPGQYEGDFRMSDYGIISWEEFKSEYDERINFTQGNGTGRKESTCRLEKNGTECPICESTWEKQSWWSNGVVSGGTEACAVCGYVKDRHLP